MRTSTLLGAGLLLLLGLLTSCASISKNDSEIPSIAYLGLVDGYWQVWVTDPNGNKHRQLTSDNVDKARVSWGKSLDSLYINTTDGAFYRYNLEDQSTQMIELSVPDVVDAVVSYDERYVAFSAISTGVPDNNDIWIQALSASSKAQKITSDKGISVLPNWSRDSGSIVFMKNDREAQNLWSVSLKTGSKEQLTVSHGKEFDPTWNAFDTLAFSSNQRANYDIWIQPRHKAPVRITTHRAPDAHPSWSPQGDEIAFHSFRNNKRLIMVKNLKTEELREITDGSVPSRNPVWFHLGREVF